MGGSMVNNIVDSIVTTHQLVGKEPILRELATDSIQEVKDYLNYVDTEELPNSCQSIVREITILRYHRLGSEGVKSEGYSGVSQTYIDDLPPQLKTRLRRYRKLPR